MLASFVFNALFGLLYLGPAVAFNAYISSCTIFLNCSYVAPVIILLIRGRAAIAANKPDFYLGRYRGLAINVVAVLYVVITSAVCPAAHRGWERQLTLQVLRTPKCDSC